MIDSYSPRGQVGIDGWPAVPGISDNTCSCNCRDHSARCNQSNPEIMGVCDVQIAHAVQSKVEGRGDLSLPCGPAVAGKSFLARASYPGKPIDRLVMRAE